MESDFWLETSAKDMPDRARRFLDLTLRPLAPYRDRIRAVRNGQGLLQPGHTCWLIGSEGQPALIVGDLMHIGAVHLRRPDVRMMYDLDPVEAAASRRPVLDWVANERIPIAGVHLAAPDFGRVARHGDDGYRLECDD